MPDHDSNFPGREAAREFRGFGAGAQRLRLAWEVSRGQQDSANLSASLFDISLPLWSMSAKILESHGSSWLSERTRKRFQDFGSRAKGTSSLSKNLNDSKSEIEGMSKSSRIDKYTALALHA
jgi:hypothetical protein